MKTNNIPSHHMFGHEDTKTQSPRHMFGHEDTKTQSPRHLFGHEATKTQSPRHLFGHEDIRQGGQAPTQRKALPNSWHRAFAPDACPPRWANLSALCVFNGGRGPSIFLAILFLLAARPAQAQDMEVKSKIESVTVFLQGAQINRTATVNLKKGKNTVYFRGLGEGINPQSIQASAPEAFLINSVIHEQNYLDAQIESPRVKMYQDSLLIVDRLIEDNNDKRTVLEHEKKMILENQAVGSKEQGLSIDELLKVTDFCKQRFTEIITRQTALTRENAKIALRRAALRNQLNELNAKRNRVSNDIRVIVDATEAATADIALSYFVQGASWTPTYNIRVAEANAPISLEYRANVRQNTGIDWEDVQLTLSSGNPNAGGTQPVLSPWNLRVQEPPRSAGYALDQVIVTGKEKGRVVDAEKVMESEESFEDSERRFQSMDSIKLDYGQQTTLANYTTVQEGATTAEFRISVAQTIKSDGKDEQVSVREARLPGIFHHYAVPKLDHDAFLVAGIVGWDTLNLLRGAAQVFFEGTYVTEVGIDPAFTSDTLLLSMGRDKKVIVERNQLSDFNKVRTLGTNRERTFAYEFKVRNTKNGPVTLTLEDQIPVSQDKEIVVTLVDAMGVKPDPDTGKLVWELQLAPAETKVVKLMYTVKHPKNKYVQGM